MLATNHTLATLLVVTLFTVTVTTISGPSRRVFEEHIVIVGAGAAGIAAATKLLENGVNNFVILEAEHRYGGRINTVRFDDSVVDLGAQWVHGERGNVVFNMANQHNLLVKYEDSPAFIDSSGNTISNETSATLYNLLEELSENSTFQLQNSTTSVGEYITEQYEREMNDSSLSNLPLRRPFLNWYEKALDSVDGSDSWFMTSGHGYSEYEELEGSQDWSWRSEGYIKILDLLMKSFPDPSQELPVKEKIYYGTKVLKIRWNNLPEELSSKILVDCTGGVTYVADHVIVTVGLGVLKEESLFQPELAAKKLSAIRGLGFGTVDKIYMKFPHKWWPDSHTEFDLLWTTDDTCSIESQGNITEDRQPECWHQQVFSFQEVQPQSQVLCGWLSGAAARYMEQLSAYDVKQKMIELLNRFVGTAFNVTVPSPEHFIRSQWNSNPNFRGSYSFRSVETETLGTSAADLAEPVKNSNGNSVLLFAGEATHSSHYSTVHGAIESGWREAERILTDCTQSIITNTIGHRYQELHHCSIGNTFPTKPPETSSSSSKTIGESRK